MSSEVLRVLMRYTGAWFECGRYVLGDVVERDMNLFMSLQDCNGEDPRDKSTLFIFWFPVTELFLPETLEKNKIIHFDPRTDEDVSARLPIPPDTASLVIYDPALKSLFFQDFETDGTRASFIPTPFKRKLTTGDVARGFIRLPFGVFVSLLECSIVNVDGFLPLRYGEDYIIDCGEDGGSKFERLIWTQKGFESIAEAGMELRCMFFRFGLGDELETELIPGPPGQRGPKGDKGNTGGVYEIKRGEHVIAAEDIANGYFDVGFDIDATCVHLTEIIPRGFLKQMFSVDFSVVQDGLGQLRRIEFIEPHIFELGMVVEYLICI